MFLRAARLPSYCYIPRRISAARSRSITFSASLSKTWSRRTPHGVPGSFKNGKKEIPKLTGTALDSKDGDKLPPLTSIKLRAPSPSDNGGPVIHSKETVEALIAGTLDARELTKGRQNSKQKARGRKKRSGKYKNKEEEIPEWGGLVSTEEPELSQASLGASTQSTEVDEASKVRQTKAELHSNEPSAKRMDEDLPAVEDSVTKAQTEDEPAMIQPSNEVAENQQEDIKQKEPLTLKAYETEQLIEKPPRKPLQDELVHSKPIPIGALGLPVDVVMLKNPNQMRKSKKQARVVEKESLKPDEVEINWEDQLLTEGETDEEALGAALKLIDDLRPAETTTLRINDFDDLANALLNGFTHEQLHAYLVKNRAYASAKDPQRPEYSWISKQGPWVAAKPAHWGPLRPKQNEIISIMQVVWGLDVQEQVEGLGRTLVWLKPDIFHLLAPQANSVLEQVASELLYASNKESIIPSFEEFRIAIHARKSTIPVILSRLDEIVQSITSCTVSVSHIKDDNLRSGALDQLAKITRTRIKHKKQDSELEISWLAIEEGHRDTLTNSNTETPADVVLRLLVERQARDPKSTLQIIGPSKNSSEPGQFIQHERERRSMYWRDKLRSWYRYVLPVGTEALGDNISTQFLGQVSLPGPTSRDGAITNRITATFGHILHTRQEKRVVAMTKHRRILSPVIPHPAAFTAITSEDTAVTQQTSIVLNFTPNPKRETDEPGTVVPEVVLRLPVDSDTDLASFSFPPNSTLDGVIPWYTNDILLPSESVDLQLSQTHLLPLDINQQSVKDFLALCDFNLLEGRLRTPSEISFSIPRRWMQKDKRKGKTPSSSVTMPYLFMGLEIHQTVEMEWQGHTLRYSSIEAGQHGGQRQELCLQAGQPQKLPDGKPDGKDPLAVTFKDTEKSRFLLLLGEIASGKHFSWHEGHKLMQDKSSEKFSLEMLDDDGQFRHGGMPARRPRHLEYDDEIDVEDLSPLLEDVDQTIPKMLQHSTPAFDDTPTLSSEKKSPIPASTEESSDPQLSKEVTAADSASEGSRSNQEST